MTFLNSPIIESRIKTDELVDLIIQWNDLNRRPATSVTQDIAISILKRILNLKEIYRLNCRIQLQLFQVNGGLFPNVHALREAGVEVNIIACHVTV